MMMMMMMMIVCYLQQDRTEFISVLIILLVANKSAKIHTCLEICSHLYRIVDKFSHYLISLNLNGLWATKREDVGLIVRAISFILEFLGYIARSDSMRICSLLFASGDTLQSASSQSINQSI